MEELIKIVANYMRCTFEEVESLPDNEIKKLARLVKREYKATHKV